MSIYTYLYITVIERDVSFKPDLIKVVSNDALFFTQTGNSLTKTLHTIIQTKNFGLTKKKLYSLVKSFWSRLEKIADNLRQIDKLQTKASM